MKCMTCTIFIVRRKGHSCWSCRKGPEQLRRRETSVKAALDDCEALPRYDAYNRALPGRPREFTPERPDFVWHQTEGRGTALIVEVDEQAHRYYPHECENARLTRLAATLGCALTVVRYNPDAALVRLGKRKRGMGDDHGFLLNVLHGLLCGAVDLERLAEDDTITICGNDGLRVIYLGFKDADVKHFTDAVENQ